MNKHATIIEMYQKGVSQKEIAENAQCTRQYVSLTLKTLYPGYKEEQIRRREEKKLLKERRLHSITCVYCGVVFRTTNKRRVCCSRNCYYDHKTRYYRRKPGESERDYQRNRTKATYKMSAARRELVKKHAVKSYRRDKKNLMPGLT